jgi:two-component system, cell cycle sensor histidine kinase and response regulator CckA
MTPRVLVVDDEPQIRNALERALQRNGYEAITVASGESAYAVLADLSVDAILVDLILPQLSGSALALALIRRWPNLRGRLVFMSGDPGLAVAEWPEELQGCPVLVKPFQLDELMDTVASVMEQHRHPPLEASGGGQ